ncbi:TOBE domain-containing protein [Gordonia insulae]|uniref:Mop domain-containing protein n=1 Tax=Gordonia insulae TaxID=2420509 RepID=A0A3G8JN31_9ACTN|nr:TOBE domain-containing protein [Gordonia insulae]AZG46393.1 hypothetical protein D7316_02994 [Gordonia insulae]
MAVIRVRDAARLLGVSDDTVRRWIAAGSLTASGGEGEVTTVDGAELAALARERASAPPDTDGVLRSARNRFAGLVTAVTVDGVMAQVTMQCGPFEVTSLMSADAARELQLAPGSVATAVVKATTVIVETKRDGL